MAATKKIICITNKQKQTNAKRRYKNPVMSHSLGSSTLNKHGFRHTSKGDEETLHL